MFPTMFIFRYMSAVLVFFLEITYHYRFSLFVSELSGLNIVNEDDVQCERTTLVSKKGRSKKVTIGILSENTISIKVNNIWFKNCFCIYNYSDSEQFFEEGDSGSGVFLIDEKGEPKKALGIAFAFSSTETCVCDIRNIVQAFDIAFYQEPQLMDISWKVYLLKQNNDNLTKLS